MRTDMFELLLERPRSYRGCRARKAPPYPRARLRPRVLEESERNEALGGRYAERSLNENLTPLVRWLARQVGRPWRLVYSEISAHLSAGSAVQQHVRDHLTDFVALHVLTVDGVLHGHMRHGVQPIGRWRRSFYVCPTSGLLRVAPRPRATTNADVRPLAHGRYLLRRRGAWHLVETRKLTPELARSVCAYSGLTLGSTAYYHARVVGKVPWRSDEVAVRAFQPSKVLLAALFREAEACARAARRAAQERLAR